MSATAARTAPATTSRIEKGGRDWRAAPTRLDYDALLIWRAPDLGRRRVALRGALVGVAVAAVPLLVYMLVNSTVWDRGLFLGAGFLGLCVLIRVRFGELRGGVRIRHA